MIPILFPSYAKEFSTRGLGPLSDAIACRVVEERNSTYELTMTYPKDGLHFSDIVVNNIIYAIPSPYRSPQAFRIYKISKPMQGKVTVKAQHLSYDLSGVVVSPFSGYSVADIFNKIPKYSTPSNNFAFFGESELTRSCTYDVPYTVRQILGGIEGSVLDTFGGEYEFDNFSVKLHSNRGTNNGVTVKYGKNLLKIAQDIDVSGVVTGVYPYWIGDEENVCGEVVRRDGQFDIERIVPLDLSNEFADAPTVSQLNARAFTYMDANLSAEPELNCTVSFALIDQYDEYKEFALLEKCDLCDVITVKYSDLGVDSTAKIVKIDTDVLNEKYNSVTIGSIRANIAQTISQQQKAVEDVPTMASVSQIVKSSLGNITGANGGTVRLLDTNDDGEPDTLYIADDPDPTKAKKVWRFNYLGWAASKNGYNGPFEMGATLDDGLLAEFVTAAHLIAGTIQSADGETFFLDLDNGILRMKSISDLESKTEKIQTQINAMPGEINMAVSNIHVGGRNLYIGSRDFSGGNWPNLQNWTRDGSYNGFAVYKKSVEWDGLYQTIPLSSGDTVTISFYAKVENGGNIQTSPRNLTYGNVTTGLEGDLLKYFVGSNQDGSAWKRYSATVTATEDNVLLSFRIENSVPGKTLWLCGFKLERGNMATDWTPAPEDTDTRISNVETTLTLKADEADLKSTRDNLQSQINAVPGQITLAVQNINVGGRNLMIGSSTPPCTAYGGASVTVTRSVTVSEWGASDAVRASGKGGTNNIVFYTHSNPTRTLAAGEVAFGVHVKNSGTKSIRVGLTNYVTVSPGESRRVTGTATASGTGTVQILFQTVDIGDNFDITFWHPKVENGNKATDWMPAPEDPAAALNAGGKIVIDEKGLELSGGEVDIRSNDGDEYVNITSSGGVQASSLYAPNVAPRYDGPYSLTVSTSSTSAQIAAGTHFRSLADAFNAINDRQLTADVYITMQSDSAGDAQMRGVVGGCVITINGNNYTLNGSLQLLGIDMLVIVNDLKAERTGLNGAIIVYGCSRVQLNRCTANGNGAPYALALGRISTVTTSAVSVYNATDALIKLSANDKIISYNLIGGNCPYWCDVNLSTAGFLGTRPDGAFRTSGRSFLFPDNPDSLTVNRGYSEPIASPYITVSYALANSDTYGAGSWTWGQHNDIVQGYTTGAGRLYGCMWFDNTSIRSALSGKNIQAADLRLAMYNGIGRCTTVSVELWGTSTNYNNRSNAPALTKNYGSIGLTTPGAIDRLALPTSVITDLVAGTINGLVLYSNDTAAYKTYVYSMNYAKFYGETSGNANNKPLLTVTYK